MKVTDRTTSTGRFIRPWYFVVVRRRTATDGNNDSLHAKCEYLHVRRTFFVPGREATHKSCQNNPVHSFLGKLHNCGRTRSRHSGLYERFCELSLRGTCCFRSRHCALRRQRGHQHFLGRICSQWKYEV